VPSVPTPDLHRRQATATPSEPSGSAQPKRSWRRPHLLLLAVALLLVGLVPAAGAGANQGGHPAAAKPRIVLLHGAWADSSAWSDVIARLQGDGYTVSAPPNPLRGLAQDSAYLAAYLNSLPAGPVVLVGHSYGGAVITNAATSTPEVKALVYVDAFAPDEGESLLQLASDPPGSVLAADPATVFDAVPLPGGTDADLYVKTSVFEAGFANDLPDQAAVLAAVQRPAVASGLAEVSGPPAWKTIPSWAVVGTLDKVIVPAAQQAMAQRAGAQITEVDGGHLSMLSRPDEVTGVIEAAAASIG
jgi:pimeloyl-ACP methyl ester carboxylesterase